MNKLLTIYIVFTLFAFISCKKNRDKLTHCDNLVTDTAGTGDNGRVYMPNAFSPNGDGKNDLIRPITTNIASIVFTIYDENNNVMFNTSVLGQGWNATTTAGTHTKYYYRIQAVTNANHKIGLCGEVYKLLCYPSSMSGSFYFEDQLTPVGFTGVTTETLTSCP